VESQLKPDAFKLLLRSLRAQRSDLVIVVVYAIVIGLLFLVTPLAVQELINFIAYGTVVQPLIILSVLVLVSLLLVGVLRIFQRYLIEIIQQRLFVNTSFELLDLIRRIRHRFLSNKNINLFFEVLVLQKSYSKLLVDGVSAILQALAGFLLLAFYHPLFLIVDILLIVSLWAILAFGGRGGLRESLSESRYKYELVHWLQEAGAGADAMKLYASDQFLKQKTDKINLNYLQSRKNHFRILMRQHAMIIFLQAVVTGSLLALGGLLVIDEQLSLGQLIASELVVAAILASFDKFVAQLEISYDLLTALVKLDSLHQLPKLTAPETGPEAEALTYRTKGLELVCHRVSFGFDEANVFEELNLHLAAGEWVCVHGPSGSGKRTLLTLLAGLERPESGSIYYDGVDHRQLTPEQIGEHVSVLQGDRRLLFEGTIAENIHMGRPGRLGLVRLKDLCDIGPDLHASIKVSGVDYSSSQVLSVLLARALYSQPRLLILDRSFAWLREDTKLKVLNALRNKSHAFQPTIVMLGSDKVFEGYADRELRLERGKLWE
jgi:ATP-binding cassette subfamily B protein